MYLSCFVTVTTRHHSYVDIIVGNESEAEAFGEANKLEDKTPKGVCKSVWRHVFALRMPNTAVMSNSGNIWQLSWCFCRHPTAL